MQQHQQEPLRLQQLQALRTKDIVTCFLSCSVRPADRPLVDAVERVLTLLGFKCFTVGRNVALPAAPDDAVRQLMQSCDCLVGVATERLEAKERDAPDRSLSLATPYLLQEDVHGIPGGHALPYPTRRRRELGGRDRQEPVHHNRSRLAASGRVKFKAREAALVATLVELKRLALQRRSKRSASQVKVAIGWLSSIVVTGGLLLKGGDSLMRPPCFGTFYYQDPEWKDCHTKPVARPRSSCGHDDAPSFPSYASLRRGQAVEVNENAVA